MDSLIRDIPNSRLAVSSWCWGSDFYAGQFSLLEMPAKARKLGIQNLELNDFMLPVPRFSRVVQPIFRQLSRHQNEVWRYRTSTLKGLKSQLDQHQQRCICWTMNTDFCSDDKQWFGRPVYWRWGVQAVRILEPNYLRIILGGDERIKPNADDQIADRLCRFVQTVLKECTAVTIVLENHWGVSTHIGRMMNIYLKVCGQISQNGQNRFGICIDPANMADEPLEAHWDLMLRHAHHAHLKLSQHNGNPIDLEHFLAKLTDIDYAGHYVIEDPDLLN